MSVILSTTTTRYPGNRSTPLALAQYTDAHPEASTFAAAIALDALFKKMSFTLIRAHFSKWFVFFIQNVKNGSFDLRMLAALCIIVCVGMFRTPQRISTHCIPDCVITSYQSGSCFSC